MLFQRKTVYQICFIDLLFLKVHLFKLCSVMRYEYDHSLIMVTKKIVRELTLHKSLLIFQFVKNLPVRESLMKITPRYFISI